MHTWGRLYVFIVCPELSRSRRLSTRGLSTEVRLSERENRFYWTVGVNLSTFRDEALGGGQKRQHGSGTTSGAYTRKVCVYCSMCLLLNKLLWCAINVSSLQLGLGLWAPPPFFLHIWICMYIHIWICIYCMYLRVAYLAGDPVVEIAN